jgi:hypothetical protein
VRARRARFRFCKLGDIGNEDLDPLSAIVRLVYANCGIFLYRFPLGRQLWTTLIVACLPSPSARIASWITADYNSEYSNRAFHEKKTLKNGIAWATSRSLAFPTPKAPQLKTDRYLPSTALLSVRHVAKDLAAKAIGVWAVLQ